MSSEVSGVGHTENVLALPVQHIRHRNSLAPCAQREVYGICVGPILLQFTFTTVIFSHLKSSPALPFKFLLSRFWFSVCYTHHTICFISYGAHEVMTQFGKFIQQPNNKASLNSNRTQW